MEMTTIAAISLLLITSAAYINKKRTSKKEDSLENKD